jgi:hypothetical protein
MVTDGDYDRAFVELPLGPRLHYISFIDVFVVKFTEHVRNSIQNLKV